MSSFMFGPPAQQEKEVDMTPPTKETFEYVTKHKTPYTNEYAELHDYVKARMGMMPYVVHCEWDFPYLYENQPNGIQQNFTANGCTVDYTAPNGKRARKTFYFRFLPSPMYEIEMQKEYDMRMVEEAKRMKVKELDAKKDVIAEEEKSRKVSRQLSDEEALRSFQKAKMMAEQNASMPPSIDSLELEPMVIPLTEEDKIPEERQKKDAKDAKNKEKEMQMLNSFLRNKERIKGLKSPSGPSAP